MDRCLTDLHPRYARAQSYELLPLPLPLHYKILTGLQNSKPTQRQQTGWQLMKQLLKNGTQRIIGRE